MSMPRWLVLVSAIVLSTTMAPSAQMMRTSFDPMLVTAWVEQVHAHQPGTVDAAATTTSRLSMTELVNIATDVKSLAQALRNGARRFKYRNRELTRDDVQQ